MGTRLEGAVPLEDAAELEAVVEIALGTVEVAGVEASWVCGWPG